MIPSHIPLCRTCSHDNFIIAVCNCRATATITTKIKTGLASATTPKLMSFKCTRYFKCVIMPHSALNIGSRTSPGPQPSPFNVCLVAYSNVGYTMHSHECRHKTLHSCCILARFVALFMCINACGMQLAVSFKATCIISISKRCTYNCGDQYTRF